MSETELLDLVDEHDRVIGTVVRGEFDHRAYQRGYVRAAEAFIVNQAGELWIPRRTANKVHAPNGLDFSVSEHVASGESYSEALVRGFREEININVVPAGLEYVGKIPPTDAMPWFAAIYVYKSNTTPRFNPEDFTEGRWITPAELLKLLKAGELAKSGLAPAVKFLQANYARREHLTSEQA